jgi:zinc protease
MSTWRNTAVGAWAVAMSLTAGQSLANSDQTSSFTLGNGLEVVVIEDHRAPVVVQMLWYRAGAADEPPGQSGVAHFLEHLLFKATKTLAAGEFSKTVAENGGTDNAFTSYDYTAYYQRIAADRLPLIMRMEADRMVNIQLSEADIATERDVIIEERNQRTENDPGALFAEQKNAAQFLNHRYGVPIIGWRHEMVDLSLDDALTFYRRHYAPNNAILIIAGDVDPAEVRALAETYYGGIPANPAITPRERPQEPPQTAERRMVFEDPRVAQPYVSRSYLAPERDSNNQKTAAALTLLAEILGGGQTSVLNEKLQFDTQIAVYNGAYYRGTALDDTSFGLVIVPAQGKSLQAAETALDEVIEGFLEEGVDPAQLARIKKQLRASQIYARDNVQQMANRYGRGLTSGLTLNDIHQWPDILQAVTGEDIMSAAKSIFNKKHAVTGWLTTAPEASQ